MPRIPAFATVLLLLPSLVHARPAPPSTAPVPEQDTGLPAPIGRVFEAGSARGIGPTGASVFNDTVYYGGTRWAADSLRWEALKDSIWTFDTGVGSAFGPTGPNKPVGYHTLMEGWKGVDQTLNPQPWFRRSMTCAISGSWSLWGGLTLEETNRRCWAAGQGYGNGWHLEVTRTFNYSGAGNVTLEYDYTHELENNFDFAYVEVTPNPDPGGGTVWVAGYTGAGSGTETITLTPGATLPNVAGTVQVSFITDSDGSYSDEDGLNPTTCGAFAVDNIQISGTITDLTDFETGMNGWTQIVPTSSQYGGDFSNIVNRNTDLPPSAVTCPCGVRDSVLVFYDTMSAHTSRQDNVAISPWIDLKRGGDVGRAGRFFLYDVYAELPVAKGLFVQLRVRWYPSVCPETGTIITTPFRDQGIIFYYGEAPFCSAPGVPRLRDYSNVIEAGAEQVQIAVGMINVCSIYIDACSDYNWNTTTPWFDNVALGLYGPTTAPHVALTSQDFLQDNFAEDGTLNPSSTARLDLNRMKNTSTPGPTTVLADTLVARGDGGNTEVRLVFRVRPGPFTSQIALNVWSYQWTPEPAAGPGWYSARMDTAEQGGVVSPGVWMATFHESDPGFAGTDRTPDPVNPSQLENEILPDHILTPGSRVDYFIAARYIPPDPRNAGGTTWFVTPDTTGGRYFEVEILPSSMDSAGTWNTTLLVDHHDDRERDQQALEESGLSAALGSGATNAEGTRYDRYDVMNPSANQVSFGRPAGTHHAASLLQAYAYRNIVWHSGGLGSNQLTAADVGVLEPWLTSYCAGFECPPYVDHRFWGTGDGLATSMSSGGPVVSSFMQNVLGVIRRCSTVRDANCPNPSAADFTYCLPLTTAPGAEFTGATPTSVRGNGCSDLRSFDVLEPNAAVPTAKGQLQYVKNGTPAGYASVTNVRTGYCYRTVVDGFGVGTARLTPGDPNLPDACVGTAASIARTGDVLAWFDLPCPGTSGVPDAPEGGSPAVMKLGDAHPNPMSRSTRIELQVPSSAAVRVEIFDVTGRLVRKLIDGPLEAGSRDVVWDGRADDGALTAAGLYFYRLSAPGSAFQAVRKLVVIR